MQVIDDSFGAGKYYRERYGLDIASLGDILQQSLENLYSRGILLTPDKLFTKLERCGVKIRPGTVDRGRLLALLNRVPAEPFALTHQGARFWYESQQHPFSREEIQFLVERFPLETARYYPSLWKSHLLDYQSNCLPDYMETELFDPEECIFQQRGQKSKCKRNAALPV